MPPKPPTSIAVRSAIAGAPRFSSASELKRPATKLAMMTGGPARHISRLAWGPARPKTMAVAIKERKLKNALHQREKREERKSLGLCYCGRPPSPGLLCCEMCLREAREYTKKNKTKISQYGRERRQRKRLQGVCFGCDRLAEDEMSFCRRCLDIRNRSSSQRTKKRLDLGLCKFCSKLRDDPNKQQCQECRLKITKRGREKRRGLLDEEVEEMKRFSGYVCPGCRKNPGLDNWVHDHDHSTGKTRGMMCSNCNSALGLVEDSPKTLRGLADYLERTTVQLMESVA